MQFLDWCAPAFVNFDIAKLPASGPVSYTHLDVYKRQELFEPILSLSIVNLNSTLVAIKEIYKNEIKRYNIDFKKSSTAKTLLCSVSDEYLQGLIEQCQKEHLK